MDAFGLNDSLVVKINGVDFSGVPKWSNEDGFSCELTGFLTREMLDFNLKLPKYMSAVVNKSKKYLILNPFVNRSLSHNMKVGVPSTVKFELTSKSILKNIPWRGIATHEVKSIFMKSNSLKLWNGTEIAAQDHDYDRGRISVTFEKSSKEFTCLLGKCTIGHNVSPPSWPTFGVYKYEVHPYLNVEFCKKIKLTEIVRFARIIEGFFELMSSFPKRNTEFFLTLNENYPSDTILFLARGVERKKHEDHILSSFLDKNADMDLKNCFDEYYKHYDDIFLIQEFIRYLSSSSVFLPEGFLTACNVVETIGQNDLRPDDDFKVLMGKVENIMKGQDEDLYKQYKERIKPRLAHSVSFKDSINHAIAICSSVKMSTKLNYKDIISVRGKYRHNIVALTEVDIKTMMSFISFTWVIGLVWLCIKIGVRIDYLIKALQMERFHFSRRTQINLWGSITKT